MSDIKRFYVRDGFVLDEHPTGQVVRYSHHRARVEKLEAQIEELREMHDHDQQDIKRIMRLTFTRLKAELESDD
jgi:hypothetical protein